MDFDLTDEQRLFRRSLGDFVDREILPVARDWEYGDRYPTEIMETMRQLGLFGLTVPEEAHVPHPVLSGAGALPRGHLMACGDGVDLAGVAQP